MNKSVPFISFSPPSNLCSYFNSILISIYHNLSQICTTNTNTNTNTNLSSTSIWDLISSTIFHGCRYVYLYLLKEGKVYPLNLKPILTFFSLTVCILFGVYSPLTNIYVLNSLTGKASPLLWVPLAGVSWEWMTDECIINTSLDHEIIDSFIHSFDPQCTKNILHEGVHYNCDIYHLIQLTTFFFPGVLVHDRMVPNCN